MNINENANQENRGKARAVYRFDAGQAGRGAIDLATGKLSVIRNDLAADSAILPVGVSQRYDSGTKTWQLNLAERLDKERSACETGTCRCGADCGCNTVYRYTDGAGERHTFEEKYYYKEGGKKRYVEKCRVEIVQDRSLSYTENGKTYEVTAVIKTPEGLVLQPEIKDFINADKIEARHEDLIQVEQEITQLTDTVEDLIYTQYAAMDSNDYESFAAAQKGLEAKTREMELNANGYQYREQEDKDGEGFVTTSYVKDTNGKDLLKLLLEKQKDVYDRTECSIKTTYHYGPQSYYTYESKAKTKLNQDVRDTEKTYLEISSKLNGYSYADEVPNPTGYPDSYKSELENMYHWQDALRSQQKNYQDYLLIFQQAVQSLTYLRELDAHADNEKIIELKTRLYRMTDLYREAVKSKLQELKKDYPEIDCAGSREQLLYRRAQKALADTLKVLDYKLFVRARLVEQLPTDMVVGTDGLTRYFNAAGQLVLIADANENCVYITYQDGNIGRVVDSEERETALFYENGLLRSVCDHRGNKVLYGYDAVGRLNRVTFPGGDTAEYAYGEDGLLCTLLCGHRGVEIAYESGKAVAVKPFTECGRIYDGGADPCLRTYLDAPEDRFTARYGSAATETSQNGVTAVTIFNADGTPRTAFEKTPDGGVKKVTLFETDGQHCAFSIAEDEDAPNLVQGVERFTLGSSDAVRTVALSGALPPYETDYVLSGFAAAPNAFETPVRRKSAYCDHGAAEGTRRFELRAELAYGDETDVFIAGFDSSIKERQYAAIPVTLRETLFGSPIVPDKVTVVADFSENGGSCAFERLSLKKGGWSYTEYGPDGETVYACADPEGKLGGSVRRNTETYYTYDENGRLSEERTVVTTSSKDTDGPGMGLNNVYRALATETAYCETEYLGGIFLGAMRMLTDEVIKELLNKGMNRAEFEAVLTRHPELLPEGSDAPAALEQYFYVKHDTYSTAYEYDSRGRLVRVTDPAGMVEERFYDEKGRAGKSAVYHKRDASNKFVTEQEYAENGQVAAELDERGAYRTQYEYLSGTNIVNTVTDARGGKTAYGRDASGRLTAISQSADGEENGNVLNYTCGVMTSAESGNSRIAYEYDGKLRKTAVKLNGAEHVRYAYEDASAANGRVETVTATFADGTVVENQTDRDGNVLSVKIDGQTQAEHTYAEDGRPLTSADGVTGKTRAYAYDGEKKLERVTDGALAEAYAYDAFDAVVAKALTGEVNQAYAYAYRDDLEHSLESTVLPNGLVSRPGKALLGRAKESVLTDAAGSPKFGEYLYYAKYGDHATHLVSSMRYGVERNGKYAIGEGLKYAYDPNGNISAVYENGELLAAYDYDALNRLVREDNAALHKTYLFTYDNNGNLLSKREAEFTRKPVEEIANFISEQVNEYDAEDGDRLVVFEGQEIAYAAGTGNPVLYKGQTLVWEKGRQLKRYGGAAFSYDGYGRRIGKGDTRYVYDSGDNLVMQTDGVNTLEFYYGENGLAGISHNGAQYICRKNVQGDITNLFDLQGNLVVKYVYDAWGNQTAERFAYTESGKQVAADDPAHIGNLNPFRYRSYYYDVETGLYYLKSRYYDPEVGRFINADDISYIETENVNGLNLFSYCLNNPTDYYDPDGYAPKWLGWLFTGIILVGLAVATALTFGAAAPITGIAATMVVGATIGAYAGAGISIISQGFSSGWDKINPWQVLIDTGVGAINGALMVSPLGVVATGSVMTGVSFAHSVGTDLISTNGDWSQVNWGKAAALGVVSGIVSGVGKSFINSTKFMNKFVNSMPGVKNAAATSTIRSFGIPRDAYNGYWMKVIGAQTMYKLGLKAITQFVRGGLRIGISQFFD